MDIAKRIETAYKLGIGDRKWKPRNQRGRNQKGAGQEGDGPPKPKGNEGPAKPGAGGQDKPGTDGSKVYPCAWCGGKHKQDKCPTIPEQMKIWPWWKVKKEKRRTEKASRSSRKGGAVTDPPGGGKNVRFKKETEEIPGGETAAKKNRLGSRKQAKGGTNEADEVGADGTALVGGVSGFYKADGGCDQATVGTHYAEQLAKSGVEIFNYEKPKPAKLADGSVQNLITGFCIADIELVTKAGTVVLPRSHIDVLQGPESANLIYIGEAEEKRLQLKSYAQQLEELAKKGGGRADTTATAKVEATNGKHKCAYSQVEVNGEPRLRFRGAAEASVDVAAKAALNGKPVTSDGEACVGQHNWKVLKRTPYIFEPLAQECYITTAALRGCDVKPGKKLPKHGAGILDLDREVRSWMGLADIINGKYEAEVVLPLRVFPDENQDTVRRLTMVKEVVCRVVPSDKPALVIGRRVYEHLLERKDEVLEMTEDGDIDHAAIHHRLDEMIDACRVEGMTSNGLKEAAHMVKKRRYEVWRMKLRKGDVADVPNLNIEVEPGVKFELPKPYRRRYNPRETKWWDENTKELVRIGVLRPSGSGQLSPSNLLPKKRDGVVLPDDFRMIIDMRAVNKLVRAMHYGLPRLDTVVHHLAGAVCFAKGDNINGYWQVGLEEAARKYTAFDTPVGAFEHCVMPMGFKNSGPWFQKVLEAVLAELLWKALIQYLDDSLLYAKSEAELLKVLDRYFALLIKFNIKLHPAKFVLFAKKLV